MPPAKQAAKHFEAEPTDRRLAGDSYVIDVTESWSFGELRVVQFGMQVRPDRNPSSGRDELPAHVYGKTSTQIPII